MQKNLLLYITIFILFFSSCKKQVEFERGFYYWKSDNNKLSEVEKDIVENCEVKRLYVKFFEVDKQNNINVAVSKSNLKIYNDVPLQEIIPCIFINNQVFLNINNEELDSLVSNIDFLIAEYFDNNYSDYKESFNEIQLDCDWTESTKDKYFLFIEKVKAKTQKQISCTLRLYPYKYNQKMGVPPCDRCCLMCYNLKSPLVKDNTNSILDTTELKAYLDINNKYPITLDIILPLYSWMVLYKNNKFMAVLYDDLELIEEHLVETYPMWYYVDADIETKNWYLKKGDIIKYEKIDSEIIGAATEIIKNNITFTENPRMSFFHLDNKIINTHSYENINNYYLSFN